MRVVDFNASMSNLSQLERHQNDGHRAPMIDQQANIEKAREEALQRTEMATEPEEPEGKNVDPRDRRREEQRRDRKRRAMKKKKRTKRPRPGGGSFVDIDA